MVTDLQCLTQKMFEHSVCFFQVFHFGELCFVLHRVMRSIGLHRKSLPPARDARISIVHRGDRVLACTCIISCIISYPIPINTLFN